MEFDVKIKEATPKAEEYAEKFHSSIDKLLQQDDLPPGMAIVLMANLNFHGRNMPASVFKRIKYKDERGWEAPEDPIILSEAFKRIDLTKGENGEVLIDRTIREKIGDFVLQYNFVRGFRPKREARRVEIPLNDPFNPNKFNYAWKECEQEKFHSEKYNSLEIDFLFNRYPFAPYQFLWIPNRHKGHNQFLDADKDMEILEAAWKLITEDGYGNSLRLCYNSNGAHASINHLHLQGFFIAEDWELPFENILRKHEGEEIKDSYLKGTLWIPKSAGVKGLVEIIREFNGRYFKAIVEKNENEKVAYNFCLTPKGTAFFPRKHQGDEKYFMLLQKSQFTTGYAFFEMLGEIICPTKDVSVFDKDETEKQIKALYDSLAL